MTKKILDLNGLQRYDSKLKTYITEKIKGLDPVPNADIEKLFNPAENASSSENLRDVNSDTSYETK